MNWILLACFIAAIGISALLGLFFIKGTFNFLRKRTKGNTERFSSQSKPIYGGILFFSVFLIFSIIYFFTQQFIPGENNSSTFIALMITIGISFFMGLADDLLNTPPLFKFLVQFICAFVLIKAGVIITISPLQIVNYAITVLWVVGIMNSINMLDNMDAITSSISLSIIAPCVIMQLINENINLDTIIMIGAAGSIIGFLFYNWAPAKMYMGDNGSQFLGILLAYIGIKYFWNGIHITDSINYAYNAKQFVIVAMAFIVPLTDTTTVTINRILKGKSPFIGGRDHTTHFLFYRGLTTRMVAVTLFSINIIGVIMAQVLIYIPGMEYWTVYIFAIYPLVVFSLLYINTKTTEQK